MVAGKQRRFRSNLHLLTHHPVVFARIYRWALVVLLAGAVLDAVTTYRNAVAFGPEVELHPASRLMMEWIGPGPGTWVGKAFQVAFAIFVASLWRAWCGWLMLLCGVLYSAAAVCNHFRIF